jgi:oligopeptide transport system substrate-binding protein
MARNRALPSALAALAIALTLLSACAVGSIRPGTAELADQQEIRLGTWEDVRTLDPAVLDSPTDVEMARNVFGGLYRTDDNLHEVPDVADGQPTVGPGGLTYTFHLRPDAVFSNGDRVTASDFVYSWSRAVAKRGAYADLFSSLQGYLDVTDGKAASLSGLYTMDAHTLVATLTAPNGSFPTLLAEWPAYVVDRKVIAAKGEDDWWKTPDGLAGTGPFRLAARTPGRSFDFVPVSRYWRGSTGTLTKVHVGIEPSPEAAVAKFATGAYDVLPTLDLFRPGRETVRKAGLESEVKRVPLGTSQWIGFNFDRGPFKGVVEGRLGREAFSLAIDRQALVKAACGVDQSCVPMSGGLIPLGLRGYAGEDPNVHFDARAARALLDKWDRDRSKVKGLKYTFESFPPFRRMAENLQAQWKANLGVDVELETADPARYLQTRNQGAYVMFREQWYADYNHPRNWFDLFLSRQSGNQYNHSGYANLVYDGLVRKADQENLSQSLGDYARAGRLLTDDVAYAGLVYGERLYLIKPYVRGVGGNSLYDYPWTEAKVLRKT